MTETAGTSNSVKVSFTVFWKIKVDNNVDGLNVNTSREEICFANGRKNTTEYGENIYYFN